VSNRPNTKKSSSASVAAARSGGGTPVWIFVVIGLVLVGGLALAVLLSQSSADDGKVTTAGGDEVEALVYGEPVVVGEPLPELPKVGADTAVGMAAPGLDGQAFSGEPLEISQGDGSRVVMFVAHWCPHCQAEVPRIVDWLAAEGTPTDVDLYAVATGTDETQPNYPPGPWLTGEDWSIPTLVDDPDGTAAQAYGLTGFPFFVAIGPDGAVVQRTSGELSEEQFFAVLEAARTGTPAGGALG